MCCRMAVVHRTWRRRRSDWYQSPGSTLRVSGAYLLLTTTQLCPTPGDQVIRLHLTGLDGLLPHRLARLGWGELPGSSTSG